MDEYTAPELLPFDPYESHRAWLRAYDFAGWPRFALAPVGNHLYSAAVCALYRFYDASRKAIYIGVTTNPFTRWGDHRRSDWWRLVRFVSLEPVDPATRLAAEQRAIDAENPCFNRMRPYGRTSTRI